MVYTHEFNPESAEVKVISYDTRWYGTPLLWLANRLTDLAYLGSVERTETVEWEPLTPSFTTERHE